MNDVIKTERFLHPGSLKELNEAYYLILLFDGAARFSIDFTGYDCTGKSLVFLSPYQLLQWNAGNQPVVDLLRFHGDFYCIEYHKEEVACNGILFNNIYEKPLISVPDVVFEEIATVFQKINAIEDSRQSADLSILRSYLQLILALSSKEKQLDIAANRLAYHDKNSLASFQSLLEKNFIASRAVSFYAAHYGLSVDAFSKQVKKRFGKTPSTLIQERLILESKRLIHLTFKSIKEISTELGFADEFYFSRFFKKAVGVSPKTFREKVGISIAAK
ncbi:helix-turn-helix transcriptional regulator [Niabella yanshanensis]|uniref:Helix-turn-helix transcriptional regulator n=1 Tax=Niabella yanshanensis TaxID=577386 RepID=A0ABZ0W6F2_9BACT|nr:AraC family transcriptional regulator [Niabella yanshanensis]WQD37112.1 helix-turn-helix transcriptional regulator [Niabella yanshanensis]